MLLTRAGIFKVCPVRVLAYYYYSGNYLPYNVRPLSVPSNSSMTSSRCSEHRERVAATVLTENLSGSGIQSNSSDKTLMKVCIFTKSSLRVAVHVETRTRAVTRRAGTARYGNRCVQRPATRRSVGLMQSLVAHGRVARSVKLPAFTILPRPG